MKVVVLIACLVAATSAVHQETQQSLLCDICKFAGKEINMRILDESAKEEVLELAIDICKVIPPSWGKRCLKLLNENGTEVIEVIFDMLDVEAYCDEISFEGYYLCPHNTTAPNVFTQLKEGESCQACKDGLNMVKTLISSADMKDMIHVIVNETCMAIGGDVASCEAITDSVIDEILGNLIPMLNVDALCRFTGSCPMPSWLAGHSSELGCLLCKDGFGIIERIVVSPELADIMNVAVNQTCQLIGYGEESCLFVGKFMATKLLSTLKQVAQPDTVCGKIGACPLTPAPKLTLDTVQNEEGCKACMDGLKIFDSILKSNETRDLVHIAVHEMCLAIGGEAQVCTDIIEGIIDPILNKAISMYDPATLCKHSGACPNIQVEENLGDACSSCTMVTNLVIDGVIGNSEFKDLIDEAIRGICSVCPYKQCVPLLDASFTQALNMIKSYGGQGLCSLFGLC